MFRFHLQARIGLVFCKYRRTPSDYVGLFLFNPRDYFSLSFPQI